MGVLGSGCVACADDCGIGTYRAGCGHDGPGQCIACDSPVTNAHHTTNGDHGASASCEMECNTGYHLQFEPTTSVTAVYGGAACVKETPAPTPAPTESPTKSPTPTPTESPTKFPTNEPTKFPTNEPTAAQIAYTYKSPTWCGPNGGPMGHMLGSAVECQTAAAAAGLNYASDAGKEW